MKNWERKALVVLLIVMAGLFAYGMFHPGWWK
jgi:hypothetical protein